MSSITIHDLDEPLDGLLRQRARLEGRSLNKTIKSLLEEALEVIPRAGGDRKEDFREFCGVWSRAEAAGFAKATGDFEKIDPEEWR